MSSNEPLPPWMRADEPARTPPVPPSRFGAPPPPGGSAPYAYAAPRSSGALTFVAILNLIFALGCGCPGSAFYTYRLVVLTSADFVIDDAARMRMETSIDQVFDLGDAAGPKGSGSGLSPEEQKRFTKAALRVVAGAVDSIRGLPEVRLLRNAAILSSAGHALIFLGSVLLLLMSRFGWWASVIGLGLFLTSSIISIQTFEGAVDSSCAAVNESLHDPVRTPDLTDAERSQLSGLVDEAQKQMVGVAAVGGVLAGLWPLISLLVLLFSRSIRDVSSTRCTTSADGQNGP